MRSILSITIALFLAFCISGCEGKTPTVDEPHVMNFRVSNSLDVNVALECIISSKDYMVTIQSGESYDYWVETMSGLVESERININKASTLRIIAPNRQTLCYETNADHSGLWIVDEEGVLVFEINEDLWRSYMIIDYPSVASALDIWSAFSFWNTRY